MNYPFTFPNNKPFRRERMLNYAAVRKACAGVAASEDTTAMPVEDCDASSAYVGAPETVES